MQETDNHMTELLTELLTVAARSGDVQRMEALRSTLGEWALQKFMPEVASRAQELADACKEGEKMSVQNHFQGTINNLTMKN